MTNKMIEKNEIVNRFNDYLGIEFLGLDEFGCKAMIRIRPELMNSIEGMVHGGVTSALADVVMGHGAAPPINGLQQCVTVENKMNYLSPAKGSVLFAESKVIKRGGTLIIMEAQVTTDHGELVAIATGTYARVKKSD
ncbi:PaaI family thioesterase [Fodinisporobacter ferrooxydans]|uniref:PaaI family thioesterase n=1 Tax=Fodinisporobacter ferrooxydans TaxID=2901836 RepID=A0ABY4CPT3_9BACL|nr:PaaI family thioesterase [Alicyclobacillaceae bacterium MYW30-H2]